MKKQLLYSVFIGLLVNGVLISANNENEQNSPVMAVLESSVPDAAAFSGVPLAHTYAHVATSVPFLVPFHKSLFDEYCRQKVSFYERKQSLLLPFAYFLLTAAGVYALYEGYNLTTKAVGSVQIAVNEGSKSSFVWHTGHCGYRFYNMHSIALATGSTAFLFYDGIKGLFKNDPSHNSLELSWQERMLAPVQEQEKQWHTIIYEKFGKPMVIEKAVTGGEQTRTVLAFQKKNGIHYDVRFNPYDQEQVRILLGIHPKVHDDLRCDQIEIISIAMC